MDNDLLESINAPWSVNDEGLSYGDEREVHGQCGDTVCRVWPVDGDGDPESDPKREYRARLIAAAPDADRILRIIHSLFIRENPAYPHLLIGGDGYGGTDDDQTLADAIESYFEKTGFKP